ncbi:MAG TPA: vWA domain-containing protein [Spirochaetia bacterium]|nr:vWA domain-containing protein [Spirochaetales bacterium]HPD80249.1 vWA domain-containing protein [Spirochaetales bacterium]HQK34221.1 vWA domain-containing protein [Spirochaetales bacterium]HRS64734.1 vWA domain-containing protein [Spirochaetia bacterium]HRV28615.1 vWA domain-containing protein [Spirochaetia bacterium]
MKKRIYILSAVLLAVLVVLYAQNLDALSVKPDDVRIEQRNDGGYHLFIKAKPGIGSVLLTETTRDPALKEANYTYRAETWNPINGDEKRILDGKMLGPESKLYSLIDSTPEPDAQFGMAFHIFIPWVVIWGYSWSRNGKTYITDGTFINIRAFAKPYADYSGAFKDNPYLIAVTQRPFERPATVSQANPEPAVENQQREAPPKDIFMDETVKAFENIADATKGKTDYSYGKSDIVDVLAQILDSLSGETLDLVICLDATDSMADDIDAIKDKLPAMVKQKIGKFKSFRLGLVLYKDYFEDFVVKKYDFTKNIDQFTLWVTGVRVQGGRDIPEAVYEALYTALSEFSWQAETKSIILIGDAPPHPIPRGKIDRAMTEALAKQLGVSISTIILPH